MHSNRQNIYTVGCLCSLLLKCLPVNAFSTTISTMCIRVQVRNSHRIYSVGDQGNHSCVYNPSHPAAAAEAVLPFVVTIVCDLNIFSSYQLSISTVYVLKNCF